jgi:hypothetical protein
LIDTLSNLLAGRIRLRSSDVPLFVFATIVLSWAGLKLGWAPSRAAGVGTFLGVALLVAQARGRPVEPRSKLVDRPLYSFFQLFFLVLGVPFLLLALAFILGSEGSVPAQLFGVALALLSVGMMSLGAWLGRKARGAQIEPKQIRTGLHPLLICVVLTFMTAVLFWWQTARR